MANLNHALRQIRRSKRQRGTQADGFSELRDEYEAVFEEVDRLGDDTCVEELTDWTVEQTEAEGTWPSVSALKQAARSICTDHGVELGDDSGLFD